jgi:phosphatidylserine/phosphatidylglycerophosphate/cardiolipin synthase-like enzyme
LSGEVELSSTASIRTALGLATADASAVAMEYRKLAVLVGQDVARGMVMGVCLATETVQAPRLVWTAPGAPAAARTTSSVARELIQGARLRVVVVGYSLTKAAAPFVEVLAAAVRRGVSCAIVADRMEEKLATLADMWPNDLGLPPLWSRPADPKDEQSALHAKFLVADGRRLFLTSANLTYHGFHANMEVGVLLEGPVATQAEGLIREWSKAKLIRKVGAPVR